MDELVSKFSSTLTSEKDVPPHSVYYKMRDEPHQSQENRRLELLIVQKQKRDSQVFQSRGILDLINDADAEDIKYNLGYKPKVRVAGFHKNTPFYANTLMLSEWMINAPCDLESNWLVLMCPKGTRVLVVASRGRTKAYTKSGYFYKDWRSTLPGGKKGDTSKYCVLDCIICDKQKSLYVLDVLAWGDIPMTNCEVNFRHYWLNCKFDEMPYLSKISNDNYYAIHLVPKFESSKGELSNLMMNWPAFPNNCPPVDGLLFYHKSAHYIQGYTPLVVWLFPFMVNEILGADIAVHENYQQLLPKDYVNQATYIENFEKQMAEKQKNSEKFGRRRVHSFSSVSSTNSSFKSPNTSCESFGSGKVKLVFKGSCAKSKEVEDIQISKTLHNKDLTGDDAAEILSSPDNAVNMFDVSTDSAFMDDSIADNITVYSDTSINQSVKQSDCSVTVMES